MGSHPKAWQAIIEWKQVVKNHMISYNGRNFDLSLNGDIKSKTQTK